MMGSSIKCSLAHLAVPARGNRSEMTGMLWAGTEGSCAVARLLRTELAEGIANESNGLKGQDNSGNSRHSCLPLPKLFNAILFLRGSFNVLLAEREMRLRHPDWPLPRPDAIHHIVEDFLTDWTAPNAHILPLRRFLENCLGTDLRNFFAGNLCTGLKWLEEEEECEEQVPGVVSSANS